MRKLKSINKETTDSLVKDIRTARAILKNINWNFYQKSVFSPYEVQPFDCRRHHWFPATFVPEIPFTLIEVLTLPGATIYDPFAGIGTTYFQALLLNRKPVATEICRVAIEYMRNLFILFNPEVQFEKVKTNIDKLLQEFRQSKDYISEVPTNILINRLKPWYSEITLNQLSFLFINEANCSDKIIKAVMRISISAILKATSSQHRGGWGCIADNVLPKQEQIKDKDVLILFKKHVNTLLQDISNHLKCVSPEYNQIYKELSKKQTIFHEDARECKKIPDNSVDLVVTSPPYPNMTDYVTSQRLSYYYLGIDLVEKLNVKDFALEIGARSKRAKGDSIDRYFEDMQKANEVISKKIKTGGYACFVMPVFATDNENNKNRKHIIQKVLSKMADYDLIKEDEYERILPTIRRSHSIKWSTLEQEKIYLFRRV